MTEEEYRAFRRMRETGALVPIKEALLPPGGWLINGCEDGDRAPEAIHYHYLLVASVNGSKACTHLPLIVGGPASAVPACPFYELTYKGQPVVQGDRLLFARVEKALQAKPRKIPNFANQPHCLCGMCRLYDVSVWDNFFYSIVCKDMLRREFGEQFVRYAVLPHFDLTGYPEARESPYTYRTYYLNRTRFEPLYEQETATLHTRVAA